MRSWTYAAGPLINDSRMIGDVTGLRQRSAVTEPTYSAAAINLHAGTVVEVNYLRSRNEPQDQVMVR